MIHYTSLLHIVLLGIVQGLTEFLPVSSSGHIVILQNVFGLEDAGVTLSVVLHLGSLVAVFVAFRSEWLFLLRSLVGKVTSEKRAGRQLIVYLCTATFPIAVAGLVARPYIVRMTGSPMATGMMLIVTALVLWQADEHIRSGQSTTPLYNISLRHAMWMGIGQAFAIVPGLSRSGTTAAAGIVSGVHPEDAARFSFLMAVPAIAGASIVEFIHALADTHVFTASEVSHLIVGAVVSCVTSLMAIRLFLRIIRRGKLRLFAYYTCVLGILVVSAVLALSP